MSMWRYNSPTINGTEVNDDGVIVPHVATEYGAEKLITFNKFTTRATTTTKVIMNWINYAAEMKQLAPRSSLLPIWFEQFQWSWASFHGNWPGYPDLMVCVHGDLDG